MFVGISRLKTQCSICLYEFLVLIHHKHWQPQVDHCDLRLGQTQPHTRESHAVDAILNQATTTTDSCCKNGRAVMERNVSVAKSHGCNLVSYRFVNKCAYVWRNLRRSRCSFCGNYKGLCIMSAWCWSWCCELCCLATRWKWGPNAVVVQYTLGLYHQTTGAFQSNKSSRALLFSHYSPFFGHTPSDLSPTML